MQPGDQLTSVLGEDFPRRTRASHVGVPAKYRAAVSRFISERVVQLVALYSGYRPETPITAWPNPDPSYCKIQR